METIKSSEEISFIFSNGKRYRTQDVTFIVLRNEKQHGPTGRVAFIAGKKLGGAVWRNRAKRRMRSLSRELGMPFKGLDVVLLARESITTSTFEHMVKDSKHVINKFLNKQ